MLDLSLLENTRLRRRPLAQSVIAELFLRVDYRKLDLVVEGLERIPAGPVIYAMNHTDNFNYWPFQYEIRRKLRRYTATWVKGKNYENKVTGTFMRVTNNIPLASRGYIITRDALAVLGRRPTDDEYRALREAIDVGRPVDGLIPRALLDTPRDILGRRFDPSREHYVEALDALFNEMIRRFVALNERALEIGLDLLVYPQGSRSIRLSRGHIGLGQMALHLGATIVPVGCSNGDLVYASRSPVCRPGRIVYRVGAPIPPEELRPFAVEGGFTPFDRDAEHAHRERFQGVVDLVMSRIDGLVDPRHRFSDDGRSDGARGTDRFL
jgi:1-acyl-sn-glycerol-3-phosphate acyltransferase